VIFTSSEGGVRTLVLTPRATFKTRVSAQNRGARPWLAPILTAGEKSLSTGGGIFQHTHIYQRGFQNG